MTNKCISQGSFEQPRVDVGTFAFTLLLLLDRPFIPGLFGQAACLVEQFRQHIAKMTLGGGLLNIISRGRKVSVEVIGVNLSNKAVKRLIRKGLQTEQRVSLIDQAPTHPNEEAVTASQIFTLGGFAIEGRAGNADATAN